MLTPGEANEVPGKLQAMAARKDITVLMIAHKFRDVTTFAGKVSVLRRGRYAGGGAVADLTTQDMARMMIGDAELRQRAVRLPDVVSDVTVELDGICVDNSEELAAVDGVSIVIKGGEVLGVAGVSGNGQSELVEAVSGQRPMKSGRVLVNNQLFAADRNGFDAFKVFGLPEEPLANAAVRRMSVSENIAFRTFDKPPSARFGWWLSPPTIRNAGQNLIERHRIKTLSIETPIENVSGGNFQRTALARDLSGGVRVLIVANPCFGLDFASVAEIRALIIEQRSHGAAVLLVSEDLDEILEMSDRVAVMSGGRIAYLSPVADTDRNTIGQHMAGH